MKRNAAALKELTASVAGRVRLAQILQVIGSAATIVPFIGIVELGRILLGPGEIDSGRAWFIVFIVVAGLGQRAFFTGVALSITHFADVELQGMLRRRVIAKLSRMPLGWFTRTSSGRVRKAVQGDVSDMHHLIAHAQVEATAAMATPLFAFLFCLYLDWRLALLAIATLPLYIIAYAWMISGATAQRAKMDEGMGRISATIVEFVSGVAVVKTFGQTGKAHKAFTDASDAFSTDFAAYMRPLLRIQALASMMFSAPLILVINLAGGYWFVRSGWVEPIDVLGATLVAMVLPATILTVFMSLHSKQEAAAAAQRIMELLDEPELSVPADPQTPQGHAVSFEGVSFSYPGTGPQATPVKALDGVTVTLAEGSLTALVGPSGSGKSTLATMLPRFADPDAGVVRIGGVDIRDIDPAELYRHVGFVLQDVALLDMSIADNIRLGVPDADAADIEEAARAANIHDRILALPNGYDSVVGRDAHFSGGEAQRVSIARALLSDCPVLVLDEATAFADPESEAEIQQAVSRLVVGRTVLVIAHRLGSITGADNIVVLDDGHVDDQGRHDDLVAAGGLYGALWQRWLGGTTHQERQLAAEEANR